MVEEASGEADEMGYCPAITRGESLNSKGNWWGIRSWERSISVTSGYDVNIKPLTVT